MNDKRDENRDQRDDAGARELDEQDLDSVAGGKVAKVDAFTIKQGVIQSTDSPTPDETR